MGMKLVLPLLLFAALGCGRIQEGEHAGEIILVEIDYTHVGGLKFAGHNQKSVVKWVKVSDFDWSKANFWVGKGKEMEFVQTISGKKYTNYWSTTASPANKEGVMAVENYTDQAFRDSESILTGLSSDSPSSSSLKGRKMGD